MTVEVIEKGVEGFPGDTWLVKKEEKYFVVVKYEAMVTGSEVSIFPANKKGRVTGWGKIYSEPGITHEDAIAKLDTLSEDDLKVRPWWYK